MFGAVRQAVGDQPTPLDHGQQVVRVGQQRDVGHGVAVDHQQVGQLALGDRARARGPGPSARRRAWWPTGSRPGPGSRSRRRSRPAPRRRGRGGGRWPRSRRPGPGVTPAALARGRTAAMASMSAFMHSVKPERRAAHRLEEPGREQHRRDQGRPGGHQPLDALVVHAVAVVDDVDAQVEGHEDGLPVGDVAPHLAPRGGGRPRCRRPSPPGSSRSAPWARWSRARRSRTS